MELSLSIAMGASVHVSLFVAPFLVLPSDLIAPAPMDLAFNGGLVLAVLLSVLILGQVAGDGRSDWLKGVQLLAVYVILGLAFFFAPAPASRSSSRSRTRSASPGTSFTLACSRACSRPGSAGSGAASPSSSSSRSLAICEAVGAQLFVAVSIARLVSLQARTRD